MHRWICKDWTDFRLSCISLRLLNRVWVIPSLKFLSNSFSSIICPWNIFNSGLFKSDALRFISLLIFPNLVMVSSEISDPVTICNDSIFPFPFPFPFFSRVRTSVSTFNSALVIVVISEVPSLPGNCGVKCNVNWRVVSSKRISITAFWSFPSLSCRAQVRGSVPNIFSIIDEVSRLGTARTPRCSMGITRSLTWVKISVQRSVVRLQFLLRINNLAKYCRTFLVSVSFSWLPFIKLCKTAIWSVVDSEKSDESKNDSNPSVCNFLESSFAFLDWV